MMLCQHMHPLVQQQEVIKRKIHCPYFDTCPGTAITRKAEQRYGREHQQGNGRKMATG